MDVENIKCNLGTLQTLLSDKLKGDNFSNEVSKEISFIIRDITDYVNLIS